MRLDKFLSHNNFGSRKDVRIYLRGKRVKVNDNIIKDAGYILDLDQDEVKVDDEVVQYTKNIYIMMNKPQGYECTHILDQYPSVLELLDFYREDVFFVGRLDVDTEGLLIITNDGLFSHNIAHGKKEVYKQYYVELERPFNTSFIPLLEQGLPFEDTILKPSFVEVLSPNSINLSIAEGKYHQVKRMMHACDNEVVFLKRIKIGSLVLDPSLHPGDYRNLTQEEINLFI